MGCLLIKRRSVLKRVAEDVTVVAGLVAAETGIAPAPCCTSTPEAPGLRRCRRNAEMMVGFLAAHEFII
jgi:hypothetical protein